MYDFRNEMELVWNQIKPLYEQLHAYVRRKLRDLYGPEKISREAPLPAHILGKSISVMPVYSSCVVQEIESYKSNYFVLYVHVNVISILQYE
jgi:hypothetical protein